MTVPSGLLGGSIYLDYNATTPIDPVVTDALLPYLRGGFGNPSSDHHYGAGPRVVLERAREEVAALIGAPDGQVVFWRNARAEPQTNFAQDSPIRQWTQYPAKAA